MAINDGYYSDGGSGTDGTPAANWWEGPAPAGYTGTWPPPLQPGQKYGQAFGSIDSTGMPGGGYVDPSGGYPGAAPAPAAAPAPVVDPGAGGGGSVAPPVTNLNAPFNPSDPSVQSTAWTPPTPKALPGVPTFDPGTFTPPTLEDAENDPGYQLALKEGGDAFLANKAAAGTVNTSGTLKDFIKYNQAAASQQYNNVWQRNASAYQMNLGAKEAAFAPALTGYTTEAANTQHQNDVANSDSWNNFVQQYNIYRNQKLDTSNIDWQWAQ